MELIVKIVEIIGTIAFAISGSGIAIDHHLDIFGVIIVGLITAVGGGIMRDMIIGIHPSKVFSTSYILIIGFAVSLLVFVIRYKKTKKVNNYIEHLELFSDSIGLGVFTVMGIDTTINAIPNASIILLITIGVITGCGGGVLRDVLVGETPQIFVRHFYATASLIGSIIYLLINVTIGETTAILVTIVTVTVLRLLAAHYHWNLPKVE